jgi:hypothetical protein
MNNTQQQIVAMRGDMVSKCLLEVGEWSMWAHGYENYPEPQWYSVAQDGKVVSESYWDTDALQDIILSYPQFSPERMSVAQLQSAWINQREDIQW